jgi:hypothetical protein
MPRLPRHARCGRVPDGSPDLAGRQVRATDYSGDDRSPPSATNSEPVGSLAPAAKYHAMAVIYSGSASLAIGWPATHDTSSAGLWPHTSVRAGSNKPGRARQRTRVRPTSSGPYSAFRAPKRPPRLEIARCRRWMSWRLRRRYRRCGATPRPANACPATARRDPQPTSGESFPATAIRLIACSMSPPLLTRNATMPKSPPGADLATGIAR